MNAGFPRAANGALRIWSDAQKADFLAKGWWSEATFDSMLRGHVADHPDRVIHVDPPNRAAFFHGEPMRLTWREIDAKVDLLAAHLLAVGVGPGDVVGIQLPNVHELSVSYLAMARLGAIASPFPVQYREHELTTLGNVAGLKAFVTATTIAGRANAAAIEALRTSGAIPSLAVVLAYGEEVPAGIVALDHDARPDPAALSAHVERHRPDPADCVTLCWTSGTESTPKGVPRSSGDWLNGFWTTIDAPTLTESDVILNPFPMVNMGGIAGMFGPWLVTGCRLVQHQPFDLGLFIDQIETERVTYSVAPPTVLTMMLKNDALLAGRDISSLRFLASGSAPLTSWMINGWERDRGVEVINFFGSNEGLCLVGDADSVPNPDDRAVYFPRFGASGMTLRARHAKWTKVRIVHLETGEDITEPGIPGELRLSGPTVFPGYWGGVGEPFDEQGYYRSGDVFELAGDRLQYVRYVDRVKDLIIRGGMNIAPAEIEGVLASHPLVAESVAVAWPDERLGERVCVFVALRDGIDPTALTLADVSDHFAAERVAKFKWPERLEIVDALPRNPVGKVLKRELRDRIAD